MKRVSLTNGNGQWFDVEKLIATMITGGSSIVSLLLTNKAMCSGD